MSRESTRMLSDRKAEDPCLHTGLTSVVPPPIPLKHQTPKDSVLHACAPPVAVPHQRRVDGKHRALTGGMPGQIEVVQDGRDSCNQGESAGWFSSLAIHGFVLALLGLLLAPADLGGIGMQDLILKLSNEEPLEEAVQFDVSAVEQELLPDQAPLLPDDPQPVDVPLSAIAIAGSSGTGLDQPADRGGASGGQAASGSFFGIESQGHEFVYVLDMSGSMEGRRFKRATAELVRSVGGLRDTQQFYVFLFNGSVVQMFDESRIRPAPVAATSENKRRLSQWLQTAFRGGSTDPREAIRLALRMQPSAIFMLSDGEFDDPKTQGSSSLLDGNSDTFSIVAAATGNSPIHAVAFEDPTSCENMKQLAEMTGGEYRFAGFKAGVAEKESLAHAREALARGDNATAEILLRELIASDGESQFAWQARTELATMFFDSAQVAMDDGQLDTAKEALVSMIEMDPLADLSKDCQQSLIAELLHLSRQESAQEDKSAVVAILTELADRFPDSKATLQIHGPVADGLLEEARKLNANNETVRSIKKLEEVVRKYPKTTAGTAGQLELRQIADDLLAEAQEVRRTTDDAACVKHLRRLVNRMRGTSLEDLAMRELEKLALEMLAKARDATYERDPIKKRKTAQQLDEGFGRSDLLQRMQRTFSRNERSARDLLRRGMRFEKAAEVTTALQRYKELVADYSGTLAAAKARDRIRSLEREQISDAAGAELLETMVLQ